VARAVVVWASVAGASILIFLSALAIWADEQGLDTNRWTATSTKLLENDDVRHEVARFLVRQVIARTLLKDVVADLESQPGGQERVARLRAIAVEKLEAFLGTPTGRELWRQANRDAHRQLMRVIVHDDPRPVVLELGTLARSISRQGGVIAQLAGAIPPDVGRVVVLRTHRVETAQTAARVIVALTPLLLIGAAALALVALGLARDRGPVVVALGLGAALAGAAVLILREFGGRYVVHGLVRVESARPAGDAAWSIGTSLMPDVAIPLIAAGGGLALAALAWTILRR
jgi:hypothetical protein